MVMSGGQKPQSRPKDGKSASGGKWIPPLGVMMVLLMIAKGVHSCSSSSVRWECLIDYGMLSDDIVIKNKSSFDLTNVRIVVEFPSTGVTKTRDIKVISSGEKYSWGKAVSVPRGSKGTAFLTCDQTKKVQRVAITPLSK